MKRKLFMLCLAGMLLYTNPAYATPFPDKKDEVVQDADNYLKKEDRTAFANSLKGIPGSYKVVVVESTAPEAESPDMYAQKLFDNYNLADDALMIVLDINTEQLGIYAGPSLQAKGATMTLLHDKIASFYEAFRTQKQYLTGIQTVIAEVNRELSRIENKQATANPGTADASKAEESESSSALGGIPWWIYLVGAVFAGLSIGLIYAMIRRRAIFAQVDDVEDWKEELVEKINVIEVEKPLRRSSGMTEVSYHHLADKKENLLRVRIPDVEMMILDAEEACDRFRFTLALGMLNEAREAISKIEEELDELKTDTSKVAVTKQENKVVVPEIGKQVEQMERRLSDLRLEYGLSFHELKASLDEVDTMRKLVKTSRAAGDDIAAYETTQKAQQVLEQVGQAMELIPKLVQRVKKEMPEEFKHLEEGIEQAVRDGFHLKQDSFDNALLQAKQLVMSAKSALEEGSLEMVLTHVKAFEVLIDATYQAIEDGVLARDEAAVTVYAEVEPELQAEVNQGKAEIEFVQEENRTEVGEVEQDNSLQQVAATSAPVEPEIRTPEPTLASENEHSTSEEERADRGKSSELSEAERSVLLQAIPQLFNKKAQKPTPAVKAEEPAYEEEEYELVMPKSQPEQEEIIPEEEEQTYLVIETEDDALDELERISNTLVRVRQQIKRSYLPGIPDQLKYMFEEVVQTLGRVQTIMEQYRYDLEEVAMLVQDASDLVDETERMAERIISTCQMAEGAIQYTNRYRRQNRQVNDLLTKAEISFRQLAFAEAFQLAEEARLVIEGAPAEDDNGWLLRRKKKG
ncbi:MULTISPECIES: septation ring formation regulator EzrA [Brevibacillus]|uniref:septation ring formation regulator EzrA n=1 Tax=Brevibacillus TaxID=55080 RepID=UPI000D0F38A7|nr:MULTISPECIES: septation ring formation regulator EzrA [Brevibacillus]MED1946463.1 septation ring formation regulator EzrA [Brevibacillus formosus]MED1996721.1 septation ring formation regulator EzrA [Brevibacillus formosus]MED2084638.1 septation ring formation regulator EzrA [Brevibacillus formosus]PSK11726.1 negative regulator of septation ring formation [Brevibacillus sp. NRRL NRS-603]